jgi:hypothetical protein
MQQSANMNSYTNGSAQVLLNLKKTNKQSLKIDPGTQKKLGELNAIKQLQSRDFAHR